MKIKIVANNCDWESWPQKVDELIQWFGPRLAFEFTLQYTHFTDVPFSLYNNVDTAYGSTENLKGVNKEWYDEHVSPLGVGFDMVLFVMNLEEWKGNNARGWRTDANEGPIELQCACAENEQIIWPNFPSLSAFFQITRHELLHGLFAISGQTDTTHFYWNQGKLELARDSINLQKDYHTGVILRAIAYIASIIQKLLSQQAQLPKIIPPIPPPIIPETPTLSNRDKLYLTAKESLGIDASPNDVAPDELGCAETVNAIYEKRFGAPIGGGVSTNMLNIALRTHPMFKRVSIASPGTIIISPTGSGGLNGITHGHTGYCGEHGVIMSNESASGKFEQNYTMESWRARYEKLGGYPVLLYDRI